jgi:hypothetical protein
MNAKFVAGEPFPLAIPISLHTGDLVEVKFFNLHWWKNHATFGLKGLMEAPAPLGYVPLPESEDDEDDDVD